MVASYRTILLELQGGERDEACLDMALALADADTHLVCIHVIPPFYPAVGAFGYASAGLVADVQQTYLDEAREASDAVRARFEEKARQNGLAHEWRSVEGLPGEVVPLHARYADLAVIGQTDPDRLDPGRPREFPADVVLNTGRPVVIVPYAGTFPHVGETALIAWNGSRESTRAVHDALPILRRSKAVHVLTVDPEDDTHIAGFDIAAHLARHGVTVDASRTISGDVGVGDILLSEAADLDVDLIVMGAYGHSRLRQLVLGGVSRLVLSTMTVPVLMSH